MNSDWYGGENEEEANLERQVQVLVLGTFIFKNSLVMKWADTWVLGSEETFGCRYNIGTHWHTDVLYSHGKKKRGSLMSEERTMTYA